MRHKLIILIFLLMQVSSVSHASHDLMCGQGLIWWSALLTGVAASLKLVTSAVLENSIADVIARVTASYGATPALASDTNGNLMTLNSDLSMTKVVVAMSVLETAMAAAMFASNHYEKHKMTTALAVMSLLPWLIGLVAGGAALASIKNVCGSAPCWTSSSGAHTNCNGDSCSDQNTFYGWEGGWIASVAVTGVIMIFTIIGAACIQCGDRHFG